MSKMLTAYESSVRVVKISFETSDGSIIVIKNLELAALSVNLRHDTNKNESHPGYSHTDGIDDLKFEVRCKGMRDGLYALLRLSE